MNVSASMPSFTSISSTFYPATTSSSAYAGSPPKTGSPVSKRRRQSSALSDRQSSVLDGSSCSSETLPSKKGKEKEKAAPEKAKRKKANRACASCQKAHLTCDDGSFSLGLSLGEFPLRCAHAPFFFPTEQRDHVVVVYGEVSLTRALMASGKKQSTSETTTMLVRRPLVNNFQFIRCYFFPVLRHLFRQTELERRPAPTNVARLEANNSLELTNSSPSQAHPTPVIDPCLSLSFVLRLSHAATDVRLTTAPLNDTASLATLTPPTNLYDFTAPSHDFGSEAANLEYAVLSSILNVSGFDASAGLPPSMFDGRSGSTASATTPLAHAPPPQVGNQQDGTHKQQLASAAAAAAAQAQNFAFKPSTKPTVSEPPPTTGMGVMRADDVYRLVNRPYPYTEAYHHLIRHLKESCVYPRSF
jgi:ssDNA-binding Zn-finger/Zn-ribbon topoisomerase 1